MGEKRKFHLPIFSLLEWVMILCCLITFITLGVIYKSSIFEIVSVIFGLFAVTLNMKRKKYAFAVYSLYVLIYGIFSIIQKQYGEGILNLVYNLPVYLYTLYKYYFSKNKNDTSDFKISKLSYKGYILIGILIPLITVSYGYILTLIDSKLPFLNALATSFALIACFLASKGNISQWIFWILYSASLVAVWAINFQNGGEAGLLYLVLNSIYILINLYSLILWMKDLKKERIDENNDN